VYVCVCVGNKGSRAAFLVGINPELKGAPPPPPHTWNKFGSLLIHIVREMHALAGVYIMIPTVRPHMMYYICGIISLACGVEIYTTHAPLFECVTHWLMASFIFIIAYRLIKRKREESQAASALQFITWFVFNLHAPFDLPCSCWCLLSPIFTWF